MLGVGFCSASGRSRIKLRHAWGAIFICDELEIVAKVNESLFDFELMERVGKNVRRTIETYYKLGQMSGRSLSC